MKCLLKSCGNEIPSNRKKSATYCSYACYYEAKKLRSCDRYEQIKKPAAEIKRAESILATMYQMAALKKPINGNDLEALNFNFGISTGEYLDKNNRLFKVIGLYAYYMDNNKKLEVWKSNSGK
jgi:hypothetical protein